LIAQKIELPLEGTDFQLASAIACDLNSAARLATTNANPLISFSSTPAALPAEINAEFSQAALQQKTVEELQQMAKEKNIKVSGRKTDIIKGILKAVSISSSAVNTVKTELLGSSKDHPIHHLHYRQSFNPIDIHDRSWNRLQNQHTVTNWKAKFTMGLLQSSLINSWVLHLHIENIRLLPFAECVARSILGMD